MTSVIAPFGLFRTESRDLLSPEEPWVADVCAGAPIAQPFRAVAATMRTRAATRRRDIRALLRFVVDQDDEVFLPGLTDPVRAARPRQDRGAGCDLDVLAIQLHDAAAAQHVIDLVLVLLV